jgi:aminoglycoside phosphotransferase (APT) family kinase protein
VVGPGLPTLHGWVGHLRNPLCFGLVERDPSGVVMHCDQLAVSLQSVRELVTDQFPAWAGLPIRQVVSEGTVNAVFRVGARMAARLPLRRGDVVSVRRWLVAEAEAARELSGRTRFATPEPIAFGAPGAGYPLPWAVQTWITGTVASRADPSASVPFAHDLAEFIHGVRAIPTRGRTFTGPGRGGELRAHDEWMQTCLRRSQGLLDVVRLRCLWQELQDLPRPATDRMTHGDLTPGNVLVADGRLVGILDVGGLGPADPALDLVGAWHLLEAGPRRALRAVLECDDLEWARGQAWAFEQAMGAAWYYLDTNPAMSLMGRRTIQRILADPL